MIMFNIVVAILKIIATLQLKKKRKQKKSYASEINLALKHQRNTLFFPHKKL